MKIDLFQQVAKPTDWLKVINFDENKNNLYLWQKILSDSEDLANDIIDKYKQEQNKQKVPFTNLDRNLMLGTSAF